MNYEIFIHLMKNVISRRLFHTGADLIRRAKTEGIIPPPSGVQLLENARWNIKKAMVDKVRNFTHNFLTSI